jgi:hypothetical protein
MDGNSKEFPCIADYLLKNMKRVSMKKVSFLALALSCICAIAPARADVTKIGVEGFTDNYKEPSAQVDEHAKYGSLTAQRIWQTGRPFTELDTRLSYGLDEYKSIDGVSTSKISQYEGEVRLTGGETFSVLHGALSPYAGLGVRGFIDQSGGSHTNLGFVGYDRDIVQLYLPVGAYWGFTSGSWNITPLLEYDQLLYGRVVSQMANIIGYTPVNSQHTGFGVRSELMFGHDIWGRRWEFGPFFRYWNIKDSDIYVSTNGEAGLEPNNKRLQAGLAARGYFQ